MPKSKDIIDIYLHGKGLVISWKQGRNFSKRSTCRICKERLESTEYRLENWIGPEGLIHYLEDHNVPHLLNSSFLS